METVLVPASKLNSSPMFLLWSMFWFIYGGSHFSFGQGIWRPMKSLQSRIPIAVAELVTTLGCLDTVGHSNSRAVLATSQPMRGLEWRTQGLNWTSRGLYWSAWNGFVSYKYRSFGTLGWKPSVPRAVQVDSRSALFLFKIFNILTIKI